MDCSLTSMADNNVLSLRAKITGKKSVFCIHLARYGNDMETTQRSILKYQQKFGKIAPKAKKGTTGTVKESEEFKIMPGLLMSCYNSWYSLQPWRKDIRRNEEFVFGDQHSDRVYDYKSGRTMTERQLFVEQGLQPSQYNIIRNVLRTIAGVWGSNKTLPVCVAQKEENQAESDVLTATLHALYRKNELWKFDYSQLVQLMLSGLMTADASYAMRNGDIDIVNDFVDPFTWFCDNSMKDPRYHDCTLVGYFTDMPIDSIVGVFSGGSKERAQKIRSMYSGLKEERILEMVSTWTDQRYEKDFFTPSTESYGLGRVIKVLRKESKEGYWIQDRLKGTRYHNDTIKESEIIAENNLRIEKQSGMGVLPENMLLQEYEWGTDDYWQYYFLTPYGEILHEQRNPFWHGKASIIFELHEFFVGKIYPFVKDLIDTQKQINKLSAISELLTKFSAKSLMFMPVQSIATEEGYGMDYLQKEITSFDGIIPYKETNSASGGKPTYENTVAQAFTPLNVVNMYLKLSENVSGVYGALQGSAPTAGTPAQMYAQQSQNSATSLNGIFEAMNSYRIRRDKMNVQLMQQYYKDKRWIWDKKSGKRVLWDPDKVKNIEFEMSVVENTDTPAYRLMINDLLFQLKDYDTNNVLDLRGLVEAGSLPFKETLLNYINKRETQMKDAAAQGQPIPGAPMPPELQKQLAQTQFSPEVQAQLSKLSPEQQQEAVAVAGK